MRIKSLNCIFFPCLVILTSCSSNNEEQIIDAESVIPTSDYKSAVSETASVPIQDYGFNKDTAAVYKLAYDSIYLNENTFFPERFNPKKSKKLVLKNGRDSTLWYHWTFKDSIKTNNALYNWLDCFDKNCKSVKLNEKKNLQKDNFLLLISDTSLTYISSNDMVSKSAWLNYYKIHSGIADWKLIIYQKKNGKADWLTIKDDEEINVTKK
jgi:hypothetical protein